MHTFTTYRHRIARSLGLTAAALLLAGGSAYAAGSSGDLASAQQRYRQEMAVCDSGRSQQDIKTCRTEARNAFADAKRGALDDGANQYSRNAVQRCTQFEGDERSACEARVFSPSRLDGSVAGGGLVRESVIIVPVQ